MEGERKVVRPANFSIKSRTTKPRTVLSQFGGKENNHRSFGCDTENKWPKQYNNFKGTIEP